MADYKSKAKKKVQRKVKNKIRKSPIIISIILIIAILGACLYFFGDELGIDLFEKEDSKPSVSAPKPQNGEEVYFHFIDVGQGDAILVTTKAGNMLIDAGDLDSESQKALDDYLKAQNITSFKYAVFTHPDADHIGSADIIVKNYDVENVIMPDFSKNTAVYKRLISAIEEKNVNLILVGEDEDICVQSGYTFYLGSMLNTIMAPTEDFNDANEMSVVIKASLGDIDVLLTGDAEHKSEEAMLEKYKKGELDCEILKVGHHGSSTSTTAAFLAAVSPETAVISCGEGNTYGHPHEPTVERLEGADVKVYRTDIAGSIVIKVDGKSYSVVTEK